MKIHNENKRIFILLLCTVIILVILFGGYRIYRNITQDHILNISLEPLTTQEKIEDFEFLYKTIVENYPYLEVNKRTYGIDWITNKEMYVERIERGNFLYIMQWVLAELNNGHTHILSEDDVAFMREIYWDTKQSGGWQGMNFDGLNHPLVLKRYNINSTLPDTHKQMVQGENQPIINAVVKDIVDGRIASIYIPQMINDTKIQYDRELIKNYLKEVQNYQAMVIDIRGNGGGSSNYWHRFLLPEILGEPYEVTWYNFYKDGDYIKKYFQKSKMTPQKIRQLDKSNLPNLPEEVEETFTYYTPIHLEVIPAEDSIGFKGNIYLLIDDNVYSSAEMLAAFAKDTGFATLIGEQTKGDGIGSDPLLAMLPNSGYVFRFTKAMGVTEDGTCNEEHPTIPDYIVEDTTRIEGSLEDQCIQKVLELEGIDN